MCCLMPSYIIAYVSIRDLAQESDKWTSYQDSLGAGSGAKLRLKGSRQSALVCLIVSRA